MDAHAHDVADRFTTLFVRSQTVERRLATLLVVSGNDQAHALGVVFKAKACAQIDEIVLLPFWQPLDGLYRRRFGWWRCDTRHRTDHGWYLHNEVVLRDARIHAPMRTHPSYRVHVGLVCIAVDHLTTGVIVGDQRDAEDVRVHSMRVDIFLINEPFSHLTYFQGNRVQTCVLSLSSLSNNIWRVAYAVNVCHFNLLGI